MLEAIDALPTEFREVLVLSDIEGMSYGEIAETLKIPVGTVKSRLFRARRQLQAVLYAHAVEMGYIKPRETAPMSRLDCEQALAHLQDYLKRELTPELVTRGPGPPGALPRLRRVRPLRGELPADAGDPGAAGDLPQGGARADSGGAAGGGERQLTRSRSRWRLWCPRRGARGAGGLAL